MGALAHYLEEEGLATTQISLVRLHTEKMKPPRALWVPFELGRPLGAPNAPAFQNRVLLSALSLLEAPSGPVIEDFPEDAPDSAGPPPALACPLPLSPPLEKMTPDQLAGAVLAEMEGLAECHREAMARHQGTAAGTSGMTPLEAGRFLGSALGGTPDTDGSDLSLPWLVKMAAEDLKAYYLEAAARTGDDPGSQALARWFWKDTAAGRLLMALSRKMAASGDDDARLVGAYMILPRAMRED